MRSWIVITIVGLLSCAPSGGPSSRTWAEKELKWRLCPLCREVRLQDLPVRPLVDCRGLHVYGIEPARIAIAIDTSDSTIDPTESDINANGYLGTPFFAERTYGGFALRSTDLGDTVFAAEVMGSRSLVQGIAHSGSQIALIAFAGPPGETKVVAPLSTEIAILEEGFDRILATGSIGSTDLAAGISRARDSLAIGDPMAASNRNVVLLISDSPSPARQDKDAIRNAVTRASGEGIIIHTFAVARSTRGAPGLLGEIADLAGGTFHQVTEATDLQCALAEVLSP